MNILKYFNFLIIVALVLSSCSTKDCTNPLALNFNPNTSKSCSDCCIYSTVDGEANAVLQVNHLFNGSAIDTSITYNWNGRNMKISSIRYYLNTFQCNNDTLQANENYLFVDLNETSFPLGILEPSSYSSLSFKVGVEMSDNHFVPNSFGVDHPLSPKTPSMFWSVNNGHVFFEMMAQIDSSTIPDGILDETFILQFGTDALIQNIDLTLNLDVPQDYSGEVNFHLDADYAMVLDSLDLTEIFYVNPNFPTNMEQAASRMEEVLVLE